MWGVEEGEDEMVSNILNTTRKLRTKLTPEIKKRKAVS